MICTHSLHHTQCSISSAPVSSFSVLVYPDHHLQSLPIPSLLLASPPSVPLVRLPLSCSNVFPPLHPHPSSDFVFFHQQSPRDPRPHVLSPLLSHRFRLRPPFGHHYDLLRVHPVLLVPFYPCPYPCPYPSLLPFDFLSRRLHTPLGCGPSPHEPLHPRTAIDWKRYAFPPPLTTLAPLAPHHPLLVIAPSAALSNIFSHPTILPAWLSPLGSSAFAPC